MTKLEEIARAIDPGAFNQTVFLGNQPKVARRIERSMDSARAAVEAMREPTEAMNIAAEKKEMEVAKSRFIMTYEEMYHAMIGGILNEALKK